MKRSRLVLWILALPLLVLPSVACAIGLPTRPSDQRAATATQTSPTVAAGPMGVCAYLPAVSTISSAPAVVIENLLDNGTFEDGTLSGWQATQATPSTAEAHSGEWSVRIANGNIIAQIDTTPGKAYKLTAWVKIVQETGSDWGGFRLEATSWDWQQLAHSGWLLAQSLGGDWTEVALTFTATTAQTRLQVGYFGGTNRQMVVHIDDIMAFEKGQNQPPSIEARLDPLTLGALGQVQSYEVTGSDLDGAIAHVLWDFGDGTRSLSASGTREILLPGRYTATVRVTDDDGAQVTRVVEWAATAPGWPELAVSAPAASESTVDHPSILTRGSVSGTATQVRVSTDRGYAAPAQGTSTWSAEIPLQPGQNRILFQAYGSEGQIVTQERLVCYRPAGPLQVTHIVPRSTSVQRWDMFEATFAVENSQATHPQFPYEAKPRQGLEWIEGITVDVLFTPDNWATVYRRPAFLNQPYQRAEKQGQEWLYPEGDPAWTVRFAPPEIGTWKYRVQVEEARGKAQSAEQTFTVTAPANANNHGPIRVSSQDSRYFEFADGTTFLGPGHGIGFSQEGFSYAASEMFDEIGAGNQDFFRWWIAGQLWGSAWQPWASRTLDYDGTVPATGLTLERAYGNGLAALKLDAANPLMFQGFASGHAGLIPGRTYRILVRWRTEGVQGPAASGQPYGVTVKLTGWPEPGQTGSIPAVVPHVHDDTPWHVAQGDWVATGDLVPYVSLILENTTGGAAYVDEIGMYEVRNDGSLGPQLLRSPRFNSHLTFDAYRGAGIDAVLAEAAQRGLYFKLVISEKAEYLMDHLAGDGLPDKDGEQFFGEAGSATRWLHEAYWRHLVARFGAFRSVHSWELVNEAEPGAGSHFHLAADLATLAAADGNPHLASTSTWATLAEEAWKDPESEPIAYADFHAYVRGTGWIEPKEELANDSARFFHEYDQAAWQAGFGKPVVWGEQGIDGTQGTDNQDPRLPDDDEGVWLHKLTWARCGPGGVYPLYWYTDLIMEQPLHAIFGAWKRFMSGIPLSNGRYTDLDAETSGNDLRAFGQKDTQGGQAHVWIDNAHHTWRAVVDKVSIPALSGSVRIQMGRPNARFTVTWYDTATGMPSRSETISTNGEGFLALTVSDLRTDTAARIAAVP